jgi:hypothetical protein
LREFDLLFVVLLAIYLVDCVVWVPGHAFAFRSRPAGAWSRAVEFFPVLGGRWVAVLGGILPGAGGVVLAETRPPRLSPAGVCMCEPESLNGRPVAYEDLVSPKPDEHEVRAGSRTVARVATHRFAREVASLLVELAGMPVERRARRIEALFARMLDIGAAQNALQHHRADVRLLVWPVRLLALVMFVAFPFVVIEWGLRALVPAALAVLACTVLVAALAGWRIRRTYDEPIAHRVAMMILSPPLAIRADDVAGRDRLAGFHELVVARTACDETQAREIAASALRAFRYPLPSESATCCEASEWCGRVWRARLEKWIARENGPLEELLAPPIRGSSKLLAYCPRCRQQYERAGGCPDCEGLALEPFPAG